MNVHSCDEEGRIYLHNIAEEHIYEDLQRLLGTRDLVLFAGSGLSQQACTDNGHHPPDWRGLLGGIIEWCRNERLIESDHLEEINLLIEKNFLIDAGQELQENLEKSDLLRCLEEVLLCREAKASKAHELIAQIPFRAFLTTNYDELIEGEYRFQKGVTLKKFYERSLEGVPDAFRSRKPFILKLHGDISDPDSIIIGNRSYERLLDNAKYLSCLGNIIYNSSILFIGFGGSDPDLELITSRISEFDGRSKRHWMLVAKDKYPSLKAKRLWKDKGINVIQYEAEASHIGFVQFLQKLSMPPSIKHATTEDTSKLTSFAIRR
jgi:hypothetical protein